MTEKVRVPPGQHVTRGFPVLHHGEVPALDPGRWRLTIFGLVEEPLTLDYAAVRALPASRVGADVHCVTGWSKLDNTWEGVRTRDLMARVRVKPAARFVLVHAAPGFTTNLPLDDFLHPDVLLAWGHNDAPLAPEHGWPLRLVVPHLYFWKSAKWLEGIELTDEDRPGFWEQEGYHMRGDPWEPRNRYRVYPPGKDPWRV
ncbi:MAG: sulfite oxidase-like oxidoreductase [Peptococcaceae bacterium]|nr:sulfite oxidase-like oxidoreductase [Peptococcaceae bacterium]